jgi:hypothetical protein
MLTEWIVKKVSQVFSKTPEGSRLRGRPKVYGGIVYKQIIIKEKLRIRKRRQTTEKSIKGTKVRIGL